VLKDLLVVGVIEWGEPSACPSLLCCV